MKPIFCEPVYLETIWSGDRFHKIRNLKNTNIGISREICAYRGSENKISNPEFQGMTFRELIDKHQKELIGNNVDTQLVRVAFMDTMDDLSIQVHPDAQQAELVNDYEKSESWYIVEADQNACINAGTTCLDKEELRKSAEAGTMEKYIKKIPVKAGDFAMIPAKMLHACGANMLALEVGSFGGITYRLYDYGRPRKLDLDKGIEILDPTLQSEIKSFPLTSRTNNKINNVINHPEFNADIVDVIDELEIETNGSYFILTCVLNEAVIEVDGIDYDLGYTRTTLIPASCDRIKIKGNTRLIKSYR